VSGWRGTTPCATGGRRHRDAKDARWPWVGVMAGRILAMDAHLALLAGGHFAQRLAITSDLETSGVPEVR